jgi:hypothetical protein
MCVYRNEDRWDTSNVVFEKGVIRLYSRRRRLPEMRHIDWGLGVLDAAVLASRPIDETWDLADLYEELSLTGRLAGYEVAQRFYEIGSVAGLAETDRLLRASDPNNGPRGV